MKWSEQMRELESADQVYHECVVNFESGEVKLNGEIISYYDGDNVGYDVRIPLKYEKLFLDPFFVSRILVYDTGNYWHVKRHLRNFNLISLYWEEGFSFKIAIADAPPTSDGGIS